jgi:hypothetical protein
MTRPSLVKVDHELSIGTVCNLNLCAENVVL